MKLVFIALLFLFSFHLNAQSFTHAEISKNAAGLPFYGYVRSSEFLPLSGDRFASVVDDVSDLYLTIYSKEMKEQGGAVKWEPAKGFKYVNCMSSGNFVYILTRKSSQFAIIRYDADANKFSGVTSGFIKDFYLADMIENNKEIILLGAQHLEQLGKKQGEGDAGRAYSDKIRPVKYTVNIDENKIEYHFFENIPAEKKIKFEYISYDKSCHKALYKCTNKEDKDHSYYQTCDYLAVSPSFGGEIKPTFTANTENVLNKFKFTSQGSLCVMSQYWPRYTLLKGLDVQTAWINFNIYDDQNKSFVTKIRLSEIKGLKGDLALIEDYKESRQSGEASLDTLPVISEKKIDLTFDAIEETDKGYIVVLSTKVGKGAVTDAGTPMQSFAVDGYQLLSYHILFFNKNGALIWQNSIEKWNRNVYTNYASDRDFAIIPEKDDIYFVYPFQQDIQVDKITASGEVITGFDILEAELGLADNAMYNGCYLKYLGNGNIVYQSYASVNPAKGRVKAQSSQYLYHLKLVK